MQLKKLFKELTFTTVDIFMIFAPFILSGFQFELLYVVLYILYIIVGFALLIDMKGSKINTSYWSLFYNILIDILLAGSWFYKTNDYLLLFLIIIVRLKLISKFFEERDNEKNDKEKN
jgi:hypothetical protein